MQNIEIKRRLPNRQALLERLEKLPEVRREWRKQQRDTYFRVPDGRLKLREQQDSPTNLIAYHRPDSPKERISNYQLIPVSDPRQTRENLAAEKGILATVTKWRTLYLFRNVRIHLDEVEGLGDFMEFESVISENCPPPQARHNLAEIRDSLEDLLGQPLESGYLEMTLHQQGKDLMPQFPRVLLATHNRHKIEEVTFILRELPLQLISLADVPDLPDVEETGQTFAENALLKAQAGYDFTGLLTIADDSGLEVEALNGAPGLYSARFAGEHKSFADNNALLLKKLSGLPGEQRKARFNATIAIVGEGIRETVCGIVEGHIIEETRGKGGFVHDPLFVPQGHSRTFAEMGEGEKHEISHRRRALDQAYAVLKEYLRT
ncbi:MAG: RdgB/HAM1 family non-canonical purine NTP pyrophosphatase [Alphaproteobacteria bacterium]|nr:RdgB/HAM1 family non-canonical purine NTP pyrophosphatase [Alphaproteobacteria bacterium]